MLRKSCLKSGSKKRKRVRFSFDDESGSSAHSLAVLPVEEALGLSPGTVQNDVKKKEHKDKEKSQATSKLGLRITRPSTESGKSSDDEIDIPDDRFQMGADGYPIKKIGTNWGDQKSRRLMAVLKKISEYPSVQGIDPFFDWNASHGLDKDGNELKTEEEDLPKPSTIKTPTEETCDLPSDENYDNGSKNNDDNKENEPYYKKSKSV